MSWRQRLREAIDRSGMKHSLVALDARITPETLSRILTAEHQRPSLDTITRIAHAVNENVGWLLGEHGFALSAEETRRLREAVRFLDLALLRSPLPHTVLPAMPNAIPVTLDEGGIPPALAALGATLAYQVTDGSLARLGVLESDLLHVRPCADFASSDGCIVVCDVEGDTYAKVLELTGERVRLLSGSNRYAVVETTADRLRLVGVAVARAGELGDSHERRVAKHDEVLSREQER